ncbi:MAG TPA: vanadium-dependent haloperoxidase [Pyrinomonadaceae bacterium]|jgi:hypothetical protein
MKKSNKLIGALALISMMTLIYLPAEAKFKARPRTAKAQETGTSDAVVREWNQIAFTTIGAQPPFPGSRFMATVQVAVFEAVNATTGKYEPYLGTIGASPGASPEAAAVSAAHGVLIAYFSGQAANLNQRRDASLAMIPDGPAKTDGIAVGMAAAAAMLANRTNDGSAPPLTFTPTTLDPYQWQLTPGCAAGVFRHWQNVRPFAIESASQFRADPPPALDSGVYAQDFNEVQTVGDVNSTERPADRTAVARLYAFAVPPTLWNSALLQISSTRGDEITDTARTMALMNMAVSDAAVSVFDSKYFYKTWRPVTAITRGDEDANKWTTAGSFTPLISTPCFPGYPSAHGSLSGAALKVLERAYGRFNHSITVQHPLAPGIEINYTDLRAMMVDISDARVYGGIHFRFDQDAGRRQGEAVAKFVYSNMLRKAGGE